MGKIKKQIVACNDEDRDMMMKIDVQVDINSDGLFTTTLSPKDAEIIKSFGIELSQNRAHRDGFFKSETMAGLIHDIKSVMRECLNYKVISDTPVIKYYIKTFCCYCLNNQTGDIAPNGKAQFVGEGGFRWIEGTSPFTQNGWENKDFGLKVFVRPYMKKIVEYGNGKQKTFYNVRHTWEEGSYMEWLNELCGMKTYSVENLQEMEGTEENARFFVNVIKNICRINEQIGEIIRNDKLEQIIQSTLKLEIM